MILYINGDSHSVGADAVAPYSFANDEGKHWGTPHRHGYKENILASYGVQSAEMLNWDWINQGESGGSNDRIIRTTENFLEISNVENLFILIGWTTWEREEWLHDGVYYQVNASGRDQVPPELQTKYKEWVIKQDDVERERKMLFWHDKIYHFHLSLRHRGIRHLFFNTYTDFAPIVHNQLVTTDNRPPLHNWHNSYIDPYNQNFAYYYWLKQHGYQTVSENNYHYGKLAHTKWAEFLVPHLTQLA